MRRDGRKGKPACRKGSHQFSRCFRHNCSNHRVALRENTLETVNQCDLPGLICDKEATISIHLYGIPNCDTVKKARKWLEARELEYAFHDFKKEGVDPTNLKEWIADKGVDTVLNRRGTTFRKLSDAEKSDIDEAKAVVLLQEHTSMIKRPVAVHSGGILIGFKEEEWSATLSSHS